MKTSNLLKILWASVALGGVLTATISTAAGLIPGYPEVEAHDAREVAMLPSYCKYTQLFRDTVPGGNDRAEIKRMYDTVGRIFHAMHHYCWGLMKTNRALLLAKTRQVRTFYLGDAISEYNYVLTRAPADFVLLPEILTKKGENLILLGKGALAVRELERAIELKADYWPPYAALSDYYKETGDITKARELLERGLSSAPEAAALKRRLVELETRKSKPASQPRVPSDTK